MNSECHLGRGFNDWSVSHYAEPDLRSVKSIDVIQSDWMATRVTHRCAAQATVVSTTIYRFRHSTQSKLNFHTGTDIIRVQYLNTMAKFLANICPHERNPI